MKVKIVAYTPNEPETGPRVPGEIIELRDATAEIWVKNGWAIALPEEKKPEPVVERAVIETPEDHLEERETASMKRRKK